jgi:hypothetical protein
MRSAARSGEQAAVLCNLQVVLWHALIHSQQRTYAESAANERAAADVTCSFRHVEQEPALVISDVCWLTVALDLDLYRAGSPTTRLTSVPDGIVAPSSTWLRIANCSVAIGDG